MSKVKKKKLVKNSDVQYTETLYDDDDSTPIRIQLLEQIDDETEERSASSI